jgi:glutamyl-tRNA reductase
VLELRRSGAVHGAVVLDTCNRIELWCELAGATAAAAPAAAMRDLFGGLPLRERADAEAVAHLIDLATGLDSLVAGEQQILGQITRSFRAAAETGMGSPRLQSLCARAVAVARVLRRRCPRLGAPDSVGALAAQAAAEHGGRVAVVGAGVMARAAAEELQRRKVRGVWFVNRTVARAAALARHFQGTAVDLGEFLAAPAPVDAMVIALAGRELPLPLERLPGLRCIVDVSQPTVVGAAARAWPGLRVLDLDGLGASAAAACGALAQWVADSRMLAAGHGAAIWNGLTQDASELGHVVTLHVEAARDELDKACRSLLGWLDQRQLASVATVVERIARRNAHLHIQDLKSKVFA